MSRLIAILNCRILTSQGALMSGAILIEEGRIVAAGRDFLMAIPSDALLIDAEGGTIGMETSEGPFQAVTVGAQADILCRSKFGHVVWMMKEGRIVPPTEKRGAALHWHHVRAEAIRQVINLLSNREEHRHLQRLEEMDQIEQGLDLVWTFHTSAGINQTVSIRVIPTLTNKTRHIFVLDRISAQRMPEISLSNTRAHWWFYVHSADRQCYCIPTKPLKTWLLTRAPTIPLSNVQFPGQPHPLKGWAIDIQHLQSSLASIRTLPLPAPLKEKAK